MCDLSVTEELYLSDIGEVDPEVPVTAVTQGERLGLWPVFGYYRVQDGPDGDAVAVADRTLPWDVKPSRREKDPISVDITGPDGQRLRLRRYNAANYYMPLKDCPDLFVKFARLGDRGEIERQAWREWLDEYGVLGVLPAGTGPYRRDQVTDSYLTFVQEALLANETLKLFEAVNRPDGPDVETIRELLPEEYSTRVGDGPDQLESATLRAVEATIAQKVRADCYDRPIPRDSRVWRKERLSPFTRRWEFTSLLGAMWLQFKWLVWTDGLRYCAAGCGRHIPTQFRSDKKTCDATCRKRLQRTL
jgi:hypothetical protein